MLDRARASEWIDQAPAHVVTQIWAHYKVE